MIFQRALLREFASLAGAVFMALFSIAVTINLIRLLGKAAGGSIPTDAVLAFLGFFALGALPVLLSLTMFISVLLDSTQQGKSGVSMSRTGRTETAPNGDRFIVLEQGRRYEGSPGDEQYRITEFDRYAARIETRENTEPERTHKNLSTWGLVSNASNLNLSA